MTTLKYKVLLKNLSYWLELSTIAWPSTGSTNTMIVTISSVVTIQLILDLIFFSVLFVAMLVIMFAAIFIRSAIRSPLMWLFYTLCSAGLFCAIIVSVSTVFTQGKEHQPSEAFHFTLPYALAVGTILQMIFHLTDNTNTQLTNNHYGKS